MLFLSIRLAKIQSLVMYSVDKTIGKQAGLPLLVGVYVGTTLLEGNCVISIKVHRQRYFYSAIPFLRFYLILAKCQLTSIQDDSLQPVFHSKRLNTSKMLPLGQWLDRLWHNHAGLYCAAGKKNRKALLYQRGNVS